MKLFIFCNSCSYCNLKVPGSSKFSCNAWKYCYCSVRWLWLRMPSMNQVKKYIFHLIDFKIANNFSSKCNIFPYFMCTFWVMEIIKHGFKRRFYLKKGILSFNGMPPFRSSAPLVNLNLKKHSSSFNLPTSTLMLGRHSGLMSWHSSMLTNAI